MNIKMKGLSSGSSLLLLTISVLAGLSIIEGYCGSSEFTCHSDGGTHVCIPHTWKCDGHPDCDDESDELECAPNVCDDVTKFKCVNGTGCVPMRWECDGESDCPDGSDEDPSKCELKTCKPNQFSCGPGQPCIPSTWQCDHHEDCPGGEDEQYCPDRSCVADEFQCSNGQCITMRWLCDNDNDCGDNSDETSCAPPTCQPGEFLCGGKSSRCIPELWRCDGHRDCVDNSDEHECEQSPVPGSHCSYTYFMCANYECIHKSWQCDGEGDCTDGSDEFDCQITCRSDQFTCINGHQCISGQLECDGYPDCSDESDEPEECLHTIHQCTSGQFDCTMDGTVCIDLAQVCNSHNDCGQGEDERNDLCTAVDPCMENNGGCDHMCINKYRGFHCDCHPGFELTTDHKTCIDIDECKISGMCSQDCKNTIGSFQCWCVEGYIRDPSSHRFCRVYQEEPHLLFSNRYDIREMGLYSASYHSVLDQLKAAIALDFDYEQQKVYFTDVALEQIMVADMNVIEGQTHYPTTVLLQATHVAGLALDWVHKNLYWTDNGIDSIEVMSLQNKHRKTLFNYDLDEPRAIVVDPRDNQGWIYWTDWGRMAKIERAGMDGSDRHTVVSTSIKWPNGLTIDYILNRLFWVDAKLHMIESSDLRGGSRQVIIASFTHLRHPFAIAVFEDWLYWSDWETESISSVRKFKNSTHPNEVSNKVVGLQSPMDVRVYHPFKQPPGSNRCGSNNGGCSHLCLPHPKHTVNSAEMSCHCPNGMFLKEDGINCYSIVVPTSTMEPSSGLPAVTETTTLTENRTIKPINGVEKFVDTAQIVRISVGVGITLLLIIIMAMKPVHRALKRCICKCLNLGDRLHHKTAEDQMSLKNDQYHPPEAVPSTFNVGDYM